MKIFELPNDEFVLPNGEFNARGRQVYTEGCQWFLLSLFIPEYTKYTKEFGTESPFYLRQMTRIFSKKYYIREPKNGGDEVQSAIRRINAMHSVVKKHLIFDEVLVPDNLYQMFNQINGPVRGKHRAITVAKKQRRIMKQDYIKITKNYLKMYHEVMQIVMDGEKKYTGSLTYYYELLRLRMVLKNIRCLENAARVGTVLHWNVVFFSDEDFETVSDCLEYCASNEEVVKLKEYLPKMGVIFCYVGKKRKNPSWEDMEMVLLYSNNQKITEQHDRCDILLWQGPRDDPLYQKMHRSSGRVGLIVAVYLSKLVTVYERVKLKPSCVNGSLKIGPIAGKMRKQWDACCRLEEKIKGKPVTDLFLMSVKGKNYPLIPMFINQQNASHSETDKFICNGTTYRNSSIFGLTTQQVRPMAANLHRELHQYLLNPENIETKGLRETLDSLLNRINQDPLLIYMNHSEKVFWNHYDDKRMHNSGIFIIVTLQSIFITILDDRHALYDKYSPFPIKNGKEITLRPFKDDVKQKIIEAFNNFRIKCKSEDGFDDNLICYRSSHSETKPKSKPKSKTKRKRKRDVGDNSSFCNRSHKRKKNQRFAINTEVEA